MKTVQTDLLPCPFCGNDAELRNKGNEFTKSRSAEVYCRFCHTSQITGAIRNSLGWCIEKAIEKWNKRTFKN